MITLLTDFGTADHFVGVMKGVMAGIAPGVGLVDITHEVPAYGVREGAFLLEQAWRYFPKGTVHVGVVDPGVGSERRGIVVEAEGHLFVGPDNGLFSFVLGAGKVRVLEREEYWLGERSETYHGRDEFAPVAAHLARGVKASRMGRVVKDAMRSPGLEPVRLSRRAWTGAVLHVDRFGNLITNFRVSEFGEVRNRGFRMVVGLEEVELYARTYAYCPPGELCVVGGSCGYFEVVLREGSAAGRTGLVAGSPLELTVGG
ncbi:MAG: S-adenosyl-l-methionine hydroxide adenosyltransferase family protein [Acidobacteriota bacterium]